MFSLPPCSSCSHLGTTPLSILGGFPPVSLSSVVNESQLASIKIKICKAIARHPDVIYQLADELHCMGLIPEGVQRAVKCPDGRGPLGKADAVIGPVIECVRSDPRSIAPALMKALDNVDLGRVITESDLIAAAQ